jgi:hypothetical protein
VGGVASGFAYDGDGLRVQKEAGSTTLSYLYDVNRSLPVLLEDGTRKYVWGVGLAYAIDIEMLGAAGSPDGAGIAAAGDVLFYHADGLGSVRAMEGQSGCSGWSTSANSRGPTMVTPWKVRSCSSFLSPVVR